MPRFNVHDPETRQWACFSTIVDDFITEWMDENEYEEWRKQEYGIHCGPVYDANIMSKEKALDRIRLRESEAEE